LDLEWMRGFAPNDRFQSSLADAVERYLDRHPEWTDDSEKAAQSGDNPPLAESPPPPLAPERPQVKGPAERIARKYNHAERDYRNRRLGWLGERIIYHREKRRLEEAGYPRLAERVDWTSQTKGDGVGYDILSFRTDGTPRKIE